MPKKQLDDGTGKYTPEAVRDAEILCDDMRRHLEAISKIVEKYNKMYDTNKISFYGQWSIGPAKGEALMGFLECAEYTAIEFKMREGSQFARILAKLELLEKISNVLGKDAREVFAEFEERDPEKDVPSSSEA